MMTGGGGVRVSKRGDPNDGGYARKEVSAIVYKFRNAFRQYITTVHNEHAKDEAVNIQAFDPSNYRLQKVKDLLHLMIVSSNQGGKLPIEHGKLVISSSSRKSRQPTVKTPAFGTSAEDTAPPPRTRHPPLCRSSSGSSTGRNFIPDALLLSESVEFHCGLSFAYEKILSFHTLQIKDIHFWSFLRRNTQNNTNFRSIEKKT
jgi:hypothetical protein